MGIRLLDAGEVDVYRVMRLDLEALRTDPDAFGERLESIEARSEEMLQQWYEGYVRSEYRWIVIDEVDGVPRGMCGCGISFVAPTGRFVGGISSESQLVIASSSRSVDIGQRMARLSTGD